MSLVGPSSDHIMKGVIYSPYSESYGQVADSKSCELHITTNIKGQDNSLTTFELIKPENDIGQYLCLMDFITGNGIVEGNCNKAKVQSGPEGITLKLNRTSQPQRGFHIKYEGKSLVPFVLTITIGLQTLHISTFGNHGVIHIVLT